LSREALETFIGGDGTFDLVITDQTMPELTGVMLAAEPLKFRPDLSVEAIRNFLLRTDPLFFIGSGPAKGH
jgi:CheY-like chemotaxis protein